MDDRTYFSRFWVGLTVLLSFVFSVLFYPVARKTHDPVWSLVLAALGLAVIWIVYVIRAAVFSRMSDNRKQESPRYPGD